MVDPRFGVLVRTALLLGSIVYFPGTLEDAKSQGLSSFELTITTFIMIAYVSYVFLGWVVSLTNVVLDIIQARASEDAKTGAR